MTSKLFGLFNMTPHDRKQLALPQCTHCGYIQQRPHALYCLRCRAEIAGASGCSGCGRCQSSK